MPDEEKLQQLHMALSDEYDLRDFESFRAAMDDPGKRQLFHERMAQDGQDVHSLQEFETSLGLSVEQPASMDLSRYMTKFPSTATIADAIGRQRVAQQEAEFDTPIPASRRVSYDQWLESESEKQGRDLSMDREDYDIQGFWLSGAETDERGHGTDKFKKPNHPTFSDESIYHGKDGYQGGRWLEKDGQDIFVPGRTNLEAHGMESLRQYFQKYEPDVMLQATAPKNGDGKKATRPTTGYEASLAKDRAELDTIEGNLERIEGQIGSAMGTKRNTLINEYNQFVKEHETTRIRYNQNVEKFPERVGLLAELQRQPDELTRVPREEVEKGKPAKAGAPSTAMFQPVLLPKKKAKPKAETGPVPPTISAAPEEGWLEKLYRQWDPTPTQKIAHAQNVYQISKAYGLPIEQVRKQVELARTGGMDSAVSSFFNTAIAIGMTRAAPITMAGVGGYMVLSEVVNAGVSLLNDEEYQFLAGKSAADLAPEEASQVLKTTLDAAQLIATVGLLGVGVKMGKPAFEKFTKDILIDNKAPQYLFIEPEQVQAASGKGKFVRALDEPGMLARSRLLEWLGITAEKAKVAESEGVAVPVESVTWMVDKPWFHQIKDALTLMPAERAKLIDYKLAKPESPVAEVPRLGELQTAVATVRESHDKLKMAAFRQPAGERVIDRGATVGHLADMRTLATQAKDILPLLTGKYVEAGQEEYGKLIAAIADAQDLIKGGSIEGAAGPLDNALAHIHHIFNYGTTQLLDAGIAQPEFGEPTEPTERIAEEGIPAPVEPEKAPEAAPVAPTEAETKLAGPTLGPEKRYAGYPLPSAIQKKVDWVGKQVFRKPEGEIELKSWQIVKNYFAKLEGIKWQYSDKWHRELKQKFPDAEREDMMFYRQKTGNIWKTDDTAEDVTARLSPEAKQFVDGEINEHINNWRTVWNASPFTKDINAREEVIKTYLTGVYAGNVDKAYDYVVGLKGKAFVTRNFMLNKKTYLTLAEAFEKAGLVPRFRDMTDQLNYQDAHMARLLGNNELIGQIHELEKEINQKLIARSNNTKLYDQAKAEKWIPFDDPWLRAYVAGRRGKKGEKPKPAWATTRAPALVHPELASAIKGVFAREAYRPENIFWRTYDVTGSHLRYVRVSASGFHFVPLGESLTGAKGFGVLNLPAWVKRGKELLNDPVFMKELVSAGVRLRAPSEVSRHEVEGNIKAMINILEAQGPGKKVAARAIKAITWVPFHITDFMFGPYLSVLKANVFYDYQSRIFKGMEKQGRSPSLQEKQEINMEIGSLVNDQFGVQAWELMRTFNDPKVRKWMHRFIGYPDWSISALRQARAAGETGIRGELGRRYWFRYGLAFVAMQNAMSYLFTGMYNDEEDEGRIKWDWDRAHSTFENKDPKHNLNFQLPDINMTVRGVTLNPGRDEKGRRRYAHFGKQMLEIPRYVTDFSSQMFSKSNPVIQLVGTQYLGGKPYKDEIFPARGEYVAGEFKPWKGTRPWTYERMRERLLEAVTSSLPFSIQQIRQMGPATAGVLPISKGLSLYVSRDYMQKAAEHGDREMLENLKDVLEDNGYAESSIKRTISEVRGEFSKRFWSAVRSKDTGEMEHLSRALATLETQPKQLFESGKRRAPSVTPEMLRRGHRAYVEEFRRLRSE